MRTRGAILVRWLLGAVLLAAAGVKLSGLAVSAVPRVGWFAQPWVQLAVAEWELLLGLWLLSGAYPVGSWVAALGTFGAFAGVSAYLGATGVASCGCFGTIEASPWTAFAVDVAALVVLAVARPKFGTITRLSGSEWRWAGFFVGLLVLLGIATAGAFGSPQAALARLRGEVIACDHFLDLGTGRAGDVVNGEITFTNGGGKPVRLIGGTSDCNCLATNGLPITLSPGETRRVMFRIRLPETSTGEFSRVVYLSTDCDSQRVLQIQIRCHVN